MHWEGKVQKEEPLLVGSDSLLTVSVCAGARVCFIGQQEYNAIFYIRE